MDKTAFGDRMKLYEGAEADRRFLPLLPILARLDGRSFSNFTKDLERPYDPRMSRMMVETTKLLVAESSALVGYTQSDEISLLWHSTSHKSQVFFDGRVQKMVSVLASLASVAFNRFLADEIPSHADRFPVFDCRVWTVPNETEAANTFLWRERDATKNSISMAAHAHLGHDQTMGLSGKEKQAKLLELGVNWNDFPPHFRRGTFVMRKTEKRRFSPEELANLPAKHHAHANPDHEYERSSIQELEMPPFGQVTNRADVLFRGASPVLGMDEGEVLDDSQEDVIQ